MHAFRIDMHVCVHDKLNVIGTGTVGQLDVWKMQLKGQSSLKTWLILTIFAVDVVTSGGSCFLTIATP
jgi:hypothetical protein